MTLDVYAQLFDDDLDGVADRLDSLPDVAPAWPKAQVISLDQVRKAP
jgi:hypothetical protein